MGSKKITLFASLAILGIALFAAGGFGMRYEWFGELKALSGILIGVGCGIFGAGTGEVIKLKLIDKDPEYKRKVYINENDERNIHINSMAKAKAFDSMGVIYGIAMFVCILLNAEMPVILTLVAAYLLVYGIQIYYLSKYSKEM